MILLDLSYFAHRIIHPNKENIIANPDFFAHLLMTQILKFSIKLGASKENKFVICVDSGSWRKQYYNDNKPKCVVYENQTYKGNRVKDADLPWDAIYNIMNDVTDSLKNFSDFYVVKVQDAEADDVISTLADSFKHKEKIWVLSPDKDFVQLQDTNVKIFDPLKNMFKPEQNTQIVKKIHNMVGDASDNIFTIKGTQKSMKDSVAFKMLKDLDDLLATNPLMKEKYDFNEKLIDLSMCPEYIKEAILIEFEKQTHSFNPSGLLKTFMKYKMSKLSEDLPSFKLSDKEVKTPTNQFFITQEKNADDTRESLADFFD